MIAALLKFLVTFLGEALRVAAVSMLKAAIAAAIATLVKSVIEGMSRGWAKAQADRAAAAA